MPLSIATAVATVTAAATAAIAFATPVPAADTPRHCVAHLTAATATAATAAKVTCYASFTQAIAAATGGRVADAPRDARKAASDPGFGAKLKPQSPAAQAVIEIDWFAFSTFTWTVSDGGCAGNPLGQVRYSVADLSHTGLNDAIDFYQNYSGCWSRHYEHPGFQGRFIGWDSGGDAGPLRGAISSIQWS